MEATGSEAAFPSTEGLVTLPTAREHELQTMGPCSAAAQSPTALARYVGLQRRPWLVPRQGSGGLRMNLIGTILNQPDICVLRAGYCLERRSTQTPLENPAPTSTNPRLASLGMGWRPRLGPLALF